MRALEIDNTLKIDEMLAKGLAFSAPLSYQERVVNGNLGMAEALSQIQQTHLEELRTYISRGAAIEATAILKKAQMADDASDESLFEEVRLLCYSGKFSEALPKVTNLLTKNINPLTKMTSHQIKALCHYELGQYPMALTEIDRVIALENIYPRAEASLFSRSLLVRVLVKSNAVGLAQKELENLWSRIQSGNYALNITFQIIMYLRSLTELKKAVHSCTLGTNVAGMWLARRMNSPIHEGIFINELSRSNCREIAEIAKKDIYSFIERFDGVKYFTEKFEERNSSDTQMRMGFYQNSPSKIIFLKEEVLLDFSDNQLHKLKLTEQNIRMLKMIGNDKVDKADIYQTLWGVKEYHPEFHDSAIRTAIKRLRECTSADIVSENSMIYLKDTLIIT